MGAGTPRPRRHLAPFGAAVVPLALLAVSPVFWWYDVLTHALVAALPAGWARAFDASAGRAWPVYAVAALGWEWLEFASPPLPSPSRLDLPVDLTVDVVAFGGAGAARWAWHRSVGAVRDGLPLRHPGR